MKNSFEAFYPLSEVVRERAWSEGLIILDTSALLNLYRYPLAARDRLLVVLERLSDRLWLPHQAALEYHRNQPAVRLDQTAQFRSVREEVGSIKTDFKNRIDKLQIRKRHALIDAEPLLVQVFGAIDHFQEKLNEIEREQETLYQEDSLQEKLESIFESRVGQMPTQEFLDALYKDGAKRFEYKIPPGYLDANKGQSPKEAEVFTFGGRIYQRRFGDLILWKEILQKVRAENIPTFIFVTDDAKEDWWQKVGGQRIGPRPELIDEAKREGGVEGFILATSERFAERAAEMLGVEVSADLIQQISTTKGPVAELALEEEAGFLEKMADAEEGLEEITQVSEGLTLELQRIHGIMEDSTKRLKVAKDFRMRTRVTNETAAQINAAATRFEEQVGALERSFDKIEPGIEVVLERIEEIESQGGEVPGVKETLKNLFATIIGTALVAEDYDKTLADIPEATVPLKLAIRRLRDGIQRYIRAARRVQGWADR